MTLKGGDKVEGTVSDEDPDWITVDTATDQVTVRKADVSRRAIGDRVRRLRTL